MYNKTQLNPEITFKKHVFHRDQFAHYLRWTHVLKRARIGMNILDFGCGSGNLLEVLWRNKYKCGVYYGVDIREKTIKSNREKFEQVNWAHFGHHDLCEPMATKYKWDMICSFEVIEHIGILNADKFLSNIHSLMSEDTILLLSTPNYDEKVGCASNHMIDGKCGEFYHDELKILLEQYFTIEEKYGTFASQKDYKDIMNPWQIEMFNNLSNYYDSGLLSNIMAPMFPKQARNCLWVCKKK